MGRSLVFVLGILMLGGAAACENEHGAAPVGTFAPGGPVDQSGNGATSRARGENRPTGSAEAPAAWPAADLDQRYDAGAQRYTAPVGELQEVTGRLIQTSEDSIRIQPEQGEPISLRLGQSPEVLLDGMLVAQQALRQGAEVRASYQVGQGQQMAGQIEVLETPEEGRGLWQQQLEPLAPGAAPWQGPEQEQAR